MQLDVACLRWATLPNLERLARALGLVVDASGNKDRRHRSLVHRIAERLEEMAEEEDNGYRGHEVRR